MSRRLRRANSNHFPDGTAVSCRGFSWRVVRRSGSEVALNVNVERQGVNDPERTGVQSLVLSFRFSL